MLGCRDKSSGIEQRTENPRVGGSIPPLSISIFHIISVTCDNFVFVCETLIFALGVVLGVSVGGISD